MSSISKLFATSGKKFYSLFGEVATNLHQMGGLYLRMAKEDDRVKRKSLLDEIEAMENRNDNVTHKLFVELGRNFITPFDREDIHTLATSLDDIADYIWGTAKQMYYYDIDHHNASIEDFTNQLNNFIELLAKALLGLQNRRNMADLIAILNDMRKVASACDHIISELLFKLFDSNNNMDAIEVIKLTDHYNMLQNVCNKCGDSVNVLESVVIKYA